MNTSDSPIVLVYVTDHAACRDLLRIGQRLADAHGLPVEVMAIQPSGLVSPKVADEVQILHNIVSAKGHELTVLFNDDAALTAAVHARQQNAAFLVCDLKNAQSTLFFGAMRDLIPETTVVARDEDGQEMIFPALTAAYA